MHVCVERMLHAHPQLHELVFAQPHVVKGTRSLIAHTKLTPRCDVVVVTAQVTSIAFRSMPPPRSNGRGAVFVQSTKPFGARVC